MRGSRLFHCVLTFVALALLRRFAVPRLACDIFCVTPTILVRVRPTRNPRQPPRLPRLVLLPFFSVLLSLSRRPLRQDCKKRKPSRASRPSSASRRSRATCGARRACARSTRASPRACSASRRARRSCLRCMSACGRSWRRCRGAVRIGYIASELGCVCEEGERGRGTGG